MRTRRTDAAIASSLGALLPSQAEIAGADLTPVWERQMNDEQLAVIRHEGGPLCVLAAAGSGKTTTLVKRLVRFVEHVHVDPARILCVTFSKKAAQEMDERAKALGLGGVAVQTWHAFCYRVIREQPTREARWTLDEKDRAKSFVKQAAGYKHENWQGADITKVRNFIGRCKANLWAPDAPEADALARKIFGAQGSRAIRVYAISQQLIEDAGLLTFDDMLVVVARLFATDEGARREWAGRFDYVMTDEVQDNSRAQEALQEYLARDHRNLMVVGDLAQSLYSFRGAEPELLARFCDAWGAKLVTMHRNYRSGSEIIRVANDIIREGQYRLPVDMEASRADAGEGSVERVECETLEDEASEVVAAAQAYLAGGGRLSDWYVLVRLNAQSRALEDALLRAKLPYVIVGGVSFYERKEVKDLLAYLRLALGRDRDGDALRRCINAPFRFLGAKFVEKLTDAQGATSSLAEALQVTIRREGIQSRQVASANEWLRIVESVARLAAPTPEGAEVNPAGEKTKRADEVLEGLVRQTGYIAWLEKEEGEESVESSHAANVRELLRVAREFSTCGELLDYIEKTLKEGAAQRKRQSGDLLTIMSVHRSKGLEKPVVWLCGCNEGVLPHSKGDVEEERRIMYVAATRARDRLVVSYVNEMATRAGLKSMTPSRFLACFPAPKKDRERGEYEMRLVVEEDGVADPAQQDPEDSDPRAHLFPAGVIPAIESIDAAQAGQPEVRNPGSNPLGWLGEQAKCAECGKKLTDCGC